MKNWAPTVGFFLVIFALFYFWPTYAKDVTCTLCRNHFNERDIVANCYYWEPYCRNCVIEKTVGNCEGCGLFLLSADDEVDGYCLNCAEEACVRCDLCDVSHLRKEHMVHIDEDYYLCPSCAQMILVGTPEDYRRFDYYRDGENLNPFLSAPEVQRDEVVAFVKEHSIWSHDQ